MSLGLMQEAFVFSRQTSCQTVTSLSVSVTVTILRCSDDIFCFSSSNMTTDSVKLVTFLCESVFVNESHTVNLKGGDYAKNEISETRTS